ncbi:MAG: lysylphosphatidylglycerol synthase domain-containing protein [Candidatus Nitrosocosmicus sp.]|nr:lysylphosphatidylglycerol synthase domain-containing protein [Candidatus Nitrosocosmicus sp.]
MNWRVIFILVSVIPIMLIFLFTPVSLDDVLSVGIIPFLLSFLATMVRIFLQAIRFYYFVRKFIGKNVSSFWKIIFARLAGEFVTQTTPSYIGGELVRIAFLTKSGVPAGRAAWVTTMEIIADVFVGNFSFYRWICCNSKRLCVYWSANYCHRCPYIWILVFYLDIFSKKISDYLHFL